MEHQKIMEHQQTVEKEIIALDKRLTLIFEKNIGKLFTKTWNIISETDYLYKDLSEVFGETSDLYDNFTLCSNYKVNQMLHEMDSEFDLILEERKKTLKRMETFFSNSLIIHALMTQSDCFNSVRCMDLDTQ